MRAAWTQISRQSALRELVDGAGAVSLPNVYLDRATLLMFPVWAPGAQEWSRLWQCLSLDELQRAGRYRFECDRTTFVLGRSMLRHWVGRCLNTTAADVEFEYGPCGKPHVRRSGLWFNVTHSAGVVALAMSRRGPVGVDVEHAPSTHAALDIAEQFFSPAECEVLRSCPKGRRASLFYRIWTLKEAYLKAQGCGFSTSLDSFAFELPDDEARLISTAEVGGKWRFHDGFWGEYAWALAQSADAVAPALFVLR